MKKVKMVYCDYLASLVREGLQHLDMNNLIAEVSSVQLDLNDRGVMQTTDKHIFVTDVTGQKYLVTVSKVIDI
jgi:hypothetical protein